MLSNYLIDKDFEMMLLPLNILEFVYCLPKYQITSSIITPNGGRGKFHCVFGVLFVILTNIVYTVLPDFMHGGLISDTAFRLAHADAIFYSVSGIFVCVTIIVQDNRNVQLVIKMHNAYRLLHDRGGLKRFRRSNWIFVMTIFLTYFLYNLSYTVFKICKVSHLVYNLVLFYFDANIVVATRIISFLEYEVKLWKKKLHRFQRTCSETNHERLVKYLTNVGLEEMRLFRAYSDIIGAFKLCSSIFGISILVLMVEAFGHPLIYIQWFIHVNKHGDGGANSPITFVVSVVWIVKSFVLLSCLCLSCQKFYLAVADVEKASAVIRGEDRCLVYARRLSKNVYRLGASLGARRALRAGGLASVDATTPLQLLTLLGTYTIVFLQFAFT